MDWDFFGFHFCDVSDRNIAEVVLVGLCAPSIPFAAEDASCPGLLEGQADATDPCEEVDECVAVVCFVPISMVF